MNAPQMSITELVNQAFSSKVLTPVIEAKINEIMWHGRYSPSDLEALDQLTHALEVGEIAVINSLSLAA